MNESEQWLSALRERMRTLLEADRQRIHDEIRAYPTPIPRCDQQFNRLIDEREQLSRELAQLDAVSPAGALTIEGSAALEAFIDASACLDADTKRHLKAALRRPPLEPSKSSCA